MAYETMPTRSKVHFECDGTAVDLTKVLERCAWVIAIHNTDYVMLKSSVNTIRQGVCNVTYACLKVREHARMGHPCEFEVMG